MYDFFHKEFKTNSTIIVRLLVATLHVGMTRKKRWRLHSVDPTSTGLSSLGQNIIHSSIAIELCMDDERLHRSLQQYQDRLKTCLIMQYGISEAVLMKTPVFLRCLTISGWCDCIGILYSSIVLVATFKTAKICLWSARYPKKRYRHPCKIVHHLLSSSSFSVSLA